MSDQSGFVAYKGFTAKFTQATKKVVYDDLTPAEVADITEHFTSSEPTKRFKSVDELLKDLDN